MRKYFILLLLLNTLAYSQQNDKIKELGVVFGDGNNAGITYRFGSPRSLFRLHTLILGGGESSLISEQNEVDKNNFGFGLKAGKEFRLVISEKICIRQGADVSFGYSLEKTIDKTTSYDFGYGYGYNTSEPGSELITKTYMPGFNIVIGLNYNINDHLIVGFELLPFIQFYKSTLTILNDSDSFEEKEIEETGFNYGINSNSALLSIVVKL